MIGVRGALLLLVLAVQPASPLRPPAGAPPCAGCCARIGEPLDTLPRSAGQPPWLRTVAPAAGHPWGRFPRRWVWLEADSLTADGRSVAVCVGPRFLRGDDSTARGRRTA